MKHKIQFITAIACLGGLVLSAPSSSAQRVSPMAKAQAIAQQLNLTPQQKEKVLPILIDEAPKVQAIKSDNNLTKIQKVQKLKAIHQQTDPQMKAILSPQQYQKLQEIRRQSIRDATQGRF